MAHLCLFFQLCGTFPDRRRLFALGYRPDGGSIGGTDGTIQCVVILGFIYRGTTLTWYRDYFQAVLIMLC